MDKRTLRKVSLSLLREELHSGLYDLQRRVESPGGDQRSKRRLIARIRRTMAEIERRLTLYNS